MSCKHNIPPYRWLIVEHQLYRQMIHTLPDFMMFSKINNKAMQEISEENDNVVVSRYGMVVERPTN